MRACQPGLRQTDRLVTYRVTVTTRPLQVFASCLHWTTPQNSCELYTSENLHYSSWVTHLISITQVIVLHRNKGNDLKGGGFERALIFRLNLRGCCRKLRRECEGWYSFGPTWKIFHLTLPYLKVLGTWLSPYQCQIK